MRFSGLAVDVSVVVAFGFMASVLLVLNQRLYSSVKAGWQFSSWRKRPARTVFSASSQHPSADSLEGRYKAKAALTGNSLSVIGLIPSLAAVLVGLGLGVVANTLWLRAKIRGYIVVGPLTLRLIPGEILLGE